MVDIQDFNPDERIVAAAAEQRQRERRLLHVCMLLFGLVTAVLIYVWLQWTIGERTCKRWIDRGEPRLEAISIKMTSPWNRAEVICDDEEAIRYFEDCLSENSPCMCVSSNSRYYNGCTVVLRFSNGAEYRSPEPCEITVECVEFSLPGEERIVDGSGSRSIAFQDPMPDGWKQALNTLLGPESVK